MAEKEVMMKLKVDVHCTKCMKKVKKALSKFPEIRGQKIDEKQNLVIINVVCFDPEKIRDKICCKSEGSIKIIEILPVEPPPPPPPPPPVIEYPPQLIAVPIGTCYVPCSRFHCYHGRPWACYCGCHDGRQPARYCGCHHGCTCEQSASECRIM